MLSEKLISLFLRGLLLPYSRFAVDVVPIIALRRRFFFAVKIRRSLLRAQYVGIVITVYLKRTPLFFRATEIDRVEIRVLIKHRIAKRNAFIRNDQILQRRTAL